MWGGASQLQVEKPEGGWNPRQEAETWPENCCANCQLEMKTPDLGAGGWGGEPYVDATAECLRLPGNSEPSRVHAVVQNVWIC